MGLIVLWDVTIMCHNIFVLFKIKTYTEFIIPLGNELPFKFLLLLYWRKWFSFYRLGYVMTVVTISLNLSKWCTRIRHCHAKIITVIDI